MIQQANNELETLVNRYKLSNEDYVLIEKYVKLKPASRKLIIDFISDVVAGFNTDKAGSFDDIYSSIPSTPEELERQFPPVQMDKKKLG